MIISSHNFALYSNPSINSLRSNGVNSNEQVEKTIINADKPKEVSKEVNDAKGQQTAENNTSFTKGNSKGKIESELNQEQVKQLRELRNRDREVRAHEQAHAAVAGSLAKGGPSFSYERGSDGQLYAVGGEVQIDTSTVAGDPEATAAKAQKVRRAALAPAQPSQQDRSVAAAASAIEARARVEIAQQQTEDGVEKLNAAFGNEQDHAISEQGLESELKPNSEVHSKCAQCSGQHSAESHSVAINLGETFNASELIEQKGNQFNIAI